MDKKLKNKYNQFRDWQKTPFEVAPLSDEESICATCGTEYKGNFCPRCGQSSKVEPRMSAWKTLLLVLDVWGLGNRGMFRTLRDLILRPGYLICDYLQGRRSAYFPPFKLLFLLTTFSLLVGHGFNILHENYQEDLTDAISMDPSDTKSYSSTVIGYMNWINIFINFQKDYPAIFQLIIMALSSYFLYIFFKKSEILGKLTYSEFFIGVVYMVNMYIVYISFVRLFGYFGIDKVYWTSLALLYLIPLKQLSGYSIGKTILRAFCGVLLEIIAIAVLFLLSLILAIIIYP